MNRKRCKPQRLWTSIKEISAESMLQKELLEPAEINQKDLSFGHIKTKRLGKSAFVTQKGYFVGGGTNTVLNALAAYLRYLEGTARDDWKEYVVTSFFFFCTRIITRVLEFEFEFDPLCARAHIKYKVMLALFLFYF